MRRREVHVPVFDDASLETLGMTIPKLPQLLARGYSQRTGIYLSFFDEFSAERAGPIKTNFNL
jgi:hypothetical protein